MTTDFARYITAYLQNYLPRQLGASTNTIASYRDAFVLFLRYCQDERKIRPDKVSLQIMQPDLLRDFLDWLENIRKCSIPTRNQRLAALHAFFRFLHIEAPEHAQLCRQVLAIRFKKAPKPFPKYLSLENTTLLLAQPDRNNFSGLRDAALLSLLYDSGARVQEFADVVIGDIRLDAPASIRLTGKGNKTRIVPLQTDTAKIVTHYLQYSQWADKPQQPLFSNRYSHKLSRSGIKHILEKYVLMANAQTPGTVLLPFTPHCMRHTKAIDGETYIEVDKDVAEIFDEFQRAKKTYFRNIRRNKAYYSLDSDSYVEKDALTQPQDTDAAVIQKMDTLLLHEAISALPREQSRRIHAYFFLGISKSDIAKKEGVHKSTITRSINSAIEALKKFF